MQIELSSKKALVTGSTAGIGRAIAVGLAAAGAEVVVNGRDPERVERAAAEVAADADAAGRVRAAAADVGTAAGCEALIEAVPELDILVNNAATFGPVPAFEITDEQWLGIYETNVMSGVRLSRHHIPRMIDRGWGRVIFISSESALQIPVEMVHYGVSKTAQLAVARGFAEAAAGTGVTVNSVLPGPTLTEGAERMLSGSMREGESLAERARRFIAENRPTSLLGRMTDPSEVANMVVYLASPQASATTGAAISADGGVVRAVA